MRKSDLKHDRKGNHTEPDKAGALDKSSVSTREDGHKME